MTRHAIQVLMFRIQNILGLALLLYLGSYIALSYSGEYGIAASRKLQTPLGSLSIPDTRQWQPKGLDLVVVKDQNGNWNWTGNTAGYVYSPLILIDRQLWHPSDHLLK